MPQGRRYMNALPMFCFWYAVLHMVLPCKRTDACTKCLLRLILASAYPHVMQPSTPCTCGNAHGTLQYSCSLQLDFVVQPDTAGFACRLKAKRHKMPLVHGTNRQMQQGPV